MRRGHSPGRVRGSSQPSLHLRGQATAGDHGAVLTNGRRPKCQRRTLPHTKSASWSTRPPLPPRLPAPRPAPHKGPLVPPGAPGTKAAARRPGTGAAPARGPNMAARPPPR